jgi:hypothetical protein
LVKVQHTTRKTAVMGNNSGDGGGGGEDKEGERALCLSGVKVQYYIHYSRDQRRGAELQHERVYIPRG